MSYIVPTFGKNQGAFVVGFLNSDKRD